MTIKENVERLIQEKNQYLKSQGGWFPGGTNYIAMCMVKWDLHHDLNFIKSLQLDTAHVLEAMEELDKLFDDSTIK